MVRATFSLAVRFASSWAGFGSFSGDILCRYLYSCGSSRLDDDQDSVEVRIALDSKTSLDSTASKIVSGSPWNLMVRRGPASRGAARSTFTPLVFLAAAIDPFGSFDSSPEIVPPHLTLLPGEFRALLSSWPGVEAACVQYLDSATPSVNSLLFD